MKRIWDCTEKQSSTDLRKVRQKQPVLAQAYAKCIARTTPHCRQHANIGHQLPSAIACKHQPAVRLQGGAALAGNSPCGASHAPGMQPDSACVSCLGQVPHHTSSPSPMYVRQLCFVDTLLASQSPVKTDAVVSCVVQTYAWCVCTVTVCELGCEDCLLSVHVNVVAAYMWLQWLPAQAKFSSSWMVDSSTFRFISLTPGTFCFKSCCHCVDVCLQGYCQLHIVQKAGFIW